jgi:hypothetical protein
MASFCRNCGTPLASLSAFCIKCGAQAIQPAPVQPVTTTSGVSLVKVGFIVLGVLLVFGALSVAGMYYAAHRLVRNVESVTGEGSVGNAIRSAAKATASATREHTAKSKRDGCLLMTKEEASEILGVEVIRAESQPRANESGEHCDYFAKPRSVEEDAEKTKQALESIQTAKDGPPSDKAISDLVKNYSRTMVNASGDGPYFTFNVEREMGAASFAGFKMANALGSAATTGRDSSEALAGLGDNASLGIGESMLCVLKGDAVIILELGQIPDGKAKGIALARKILSRL